MGALKDSISDGHGEKKKKLPLLAELQEAADRALEAGGMPRWEIAYEVSAAP